MAILFMEGFDKYGPPTASQARLNALMAGDWTNTASCEIVNPLSGAGYALKLSAASSINRTVGTKGQLIVGFRFTSNLLNRVGLTFLDGASSQASVTINPTAGNISVRNGGISGTIIETSTEFVSAAAVHYLECDLTFGNSGAYKVYLDGIEILNGTGNLTTTANNSADGIEFSCTSTGQLTLDDLYVFDTSGGSNTAVLNTSPVVETTFPSSDSAVTFAASASFIGDAEAYTNTSASAGANALVLKKVTPAVNMTINSVSLMPSATSAGAKFKAVVYDDNAGAPDALLDEGSEVVGTTSGTVLTLPATAPQALTGGTDYWIGYITDTSVSVHLADTTALGRAKGNTYGGGAPDPAGSMSTGQATLQMWGDCTLATDNYPEVSNNAPGLADYSYVSSSNVGDEDLFGFPALSVNPAAVYAVAVKMFVRDTDAGARTLTMQCKSNVTDSSSAAVAPGTSYSWLSGYYPLDPNGDITWTYTAVNAATAGYKIAS